MSYRIIGWNGEVVTIPVEVEVQGADAIEKYVRSNLPPEPRTVPVKPAKEPDE